MPRLIHDVIHTCVKRCNSTIPTIGLTSVYVLIFSILVSTTGAEYEQLYNTRVNQILSTIVFYNYSNSLIPIFRMDMQNLF